MTALGAIPSTTAVPTTTEADAAYQPKDADLTTWAGLTPSAFFQTLVDDASAAATRTTLGIPAVVGGAEWTTVRKTADESVSSNTTVQNDDELFFTDVSGALYEVELVIIYGSPAGGGTPDLKAALGYASNWGVFQYGGWAANDTLVNTVFNSNASQNPIFGTAAADRVGFIRGVMPGLGSTFRFLWAQNSSDSNATIVRAGSVLRYRRFQ